MNNSLDTNEIRLEILEEIKQNEKKIVPFFSKKRSLNLRPLKTIKDILRDRKYLLETEFDNFFRLETTSIEYKNKMFYSKCKIIVESNKIIVFELKYKEEANKKNNDEYNPLLVLDFDLVTACVSVKAKSKKFKILVLGSNKEFEFKASTKEIFDTILIHLNFFIEKSEGAKNNLFGVSLRKDFYKV
jgi:hypothetical protein